MSVVSVKEVNAERFGGCLDNLQAALYSLKSINDLLSGRDEGAALDANAFYYLLSMVEERLASEVEYLQSC